MNNPKYTAPPLPNSINLQLVDQELQERIKKAKERCKEKWKKGEVTSAS